MAGLRQRNRSPQQEMENNVSDSGHEDKAVTTERNKRKNFRNENNQGQSQNQTSPPRPLPVGRGQGQGRGRGQGHGQERGQRRRGSRSMMGLSPGTKKFLFRACLPPILMLVAYYGYLGYQETRIYTPLAVDKVVVKQGVDVSERFWGSYRSGVYFGMKHRSPKSLLTGLMWVHAANKPHTPPRLRHNCDQNDKLKKYGWVEHDGVNFGVQVIEEDNVTLTTSFVKSAKGKKGGDWTNRITVKHNGPVPASWASSRKLPICPGEVPLLYYVALEPGLQGSLVPEYKGDSLTSIRGFTEDLGGFTIKFRVDKAVVTSSFSRANVKSMDRLSSVVESRLVWTEVSDDEGERVAIQLSHHDEQEDGNVIIYMVHAKAPVQLEVIYESDDSSTGLPLSGNRYSELLEDFRSRFNTKFERTFHRKEKGFSVAETSFSKAALSNLIGGIGYFYGHSRVKSPLNPYPVPYWNAGLYTAVPSRSFFPRGFLWDEGFHLLLINKWDPEIAIDIMGHWLDLMNTEGWIPREQILGDEALARVPEEFVVQKNDVANPPTLIMALLDLLDTQGEWVLRNHRQTLLRMWPRLNAWYQWLNRTQAGSEPFTYRWRGRNETTLRELNPKTLASGLDDYPRASHPNEKERHLDLRCWMALCSKLMGQLSDLLEYPSEKYRQTYAALTNQELLDKLHWSSEVNAYADYGLHSPKVVLQYPQPQPLQRREDNSPPEKIRKTINPPNYRFVSQFGYVSLFPMILEILPPDSPTLETTLKKLNDSTLLWTQYGLRSLAANAPLYKKYNTEHDPPYWRGAIWININFLTLKSLHYYSNHDSTPTTIRTLAKEMYEKLRQNIITNMISQWEKTGYIWEQYDDSTGEGKGCRPFTGWSSLVVLIMAEEY